MLLWGRSAADTVMGGSAAHIVMGRSAADSVMRGSAADTVMGEICCWRATGCATLLYEDSSFAQPVWLCSCCQITAPIIPTCPSIMGVVVLQQLQGHIDR